MLQTLAEGPCDSGPVFLFARALSRSDLHRLESEGLELVPPKAISDRDSLFGLGPKQE